MITCSRPRLIVQGDHTQDVAGIAGPWASAVFQHDGREAGPGAPAWVRTPGHLTSSSCASISPSQLRPANSLRHSRRLEVPDVLGTGSLECQAIIPAAPG